MSGQQLDIAPTLPQGMFLPDLMSADQAIGMVQNVEIPADNSGTSFTPTGNRVIEFLITNTGGFWDTINSYVRFQVSAVVQSATDTQSFHAYLAEGGVHALFQTVEILSANSNTSIERIDRYNRYYSQISTLTQPRNYVDSVGCREGDSAEFLSYSQNIPLSAQPVLIGSGAISTAGVVSAFVDPSGVASNILKYATSISATEVLIVPKTTPAAGSEGAVSMRLKISAASSSGFTLQMLSGIAPFLLAVNYDIYLPYSQAGVGRASNTINNSSGATSPDGPMRWQIGSNSNTTANTLATGLSSGAIQVCWQPLLGFLEMPELKLLPFFAGGGLRLRCTLADAWECFSFTVPGSTGSAVTVATASASYAIINPFLVAKIVYPTDSLMDEFYGRYKNAQPLLNYAFQSPMHAFNQDSQGSNGSSTFNIQSGLRSGKGFMMRIQDARGATQTSSLDVGESSWTCDSIAQGKKAGLSTFQLSAGGQFYFPLSRPMSVQDDQANMELMAHAQALFGGLGPIQNQFRCKPAEWQSIFSLDHLQERGSSVGNSEPQRLVIACPIRRDPSLMSGIDLSVNALLVNLYFNVASTLTDFPTGGAGAGSPRYFFMFILHDRIVSLNATNGTVVRY